MFWIRCLTLWRDKKWKRTFYPSCSYILTESVLQASLGCASDKFWRSTFKRCFYISDFYENILLLCFSHLITLSHTNYKIWWFLYVIDKKKAQTVTRKVAQNIVATFHAVQSCSLCGNSQERTFDNLVITKLIVPLLLSVVMTFCTILREF